MSPRTDTPDRPFIIYGVTRLCRGMAQPPPDQNVMPPPAKPSFVGRSTELNQIMRMLGEARLGKGQVGVIEGPAGIGKTRLAEEVVERAR